MVLDSAVAYVMDKVDFVLVGSEAVVESGGLINAVGSNQMAIIAKAANKPFYALAERLDFIFTLVEARSETSIYLVTNFIDYFPYRNMISLPITPTSFHFPGPGGLRRHSQRLRHLPLLQHSQERQQIQMIHRLLC